MKKLFGKIKTFALCGALVAVMAVGALMIDFGNTQRLSSGSVNASSDPWNGREGNSIEGTGFTEPASVGSQLTEPTYAITWIDDYAGKNFNQMVALGAEEGNFKKSTANEGAVIAETAGTADAPWLINTAQEFAYFAKLISVASNSTSYAKPAYMGQHFKLGANINLAGKRWVPPFFHYSTTLTYESGATQNMLYFDGGNKTISNAYVNQTYSSGSQLAYSSILGMLPPRSQVKDLTIDGAYITTTGNNQVSIVSQSGGVDSVFTNITVKNSYAEGRQGVNGIAINASVIKGCSIIDTTLRLTNQTATGYHARGIGIAGEFIGNNVTRTSIESLDTPFYSWSVGIGQLRESVYATEMTGSAIPAYLGGSFTFTSGFLTNAVTNTKIQVSAQTTPTAYGHAMGIGYSSIALPLTFSGNSLDNTLVSVRTEGTTATNDTHAVGMGFLNSASIPSILAENNAVRNSTVSVVSQSATTTASGMFVIPYDNKAIIRDCYTENTDVISRYIKLSSSVTTYAVGIIIGYATLVENCVVGSGNIDARNEKSNIFAYGIGGILGKGSLTGPTLRNNWSNCDKEENHIHTKYHCECPIEYVAHVHDENCEDPCDIEYVAHEHNGDCEDPCEQEYQIHEHDDNCDYTCSKETGHFHDDEICGYIGNQPEAQFINCYNFSNITTASDSIIYAAGIGMGEGFTNCFNYGNVMGNYVGGIALGFNRTTNTTPTVTSPTSSMTGGLRPLIIKTSANYGNIIKAANTQTSYMGGMFSIYYNTVNYKRWVQGSQIISVENIDGKHLEVSDCISDGKFFFYISDKPDNSSDANYTLTDKLGKTTVGSVYWGMIFGRLHAQPYSFNLNSNAADLEKFVSTRFIVKNNHYNEESCFDLFATEDPNEEGLIIRPETNFRRNGQTYSNIVNDSGYDYLVTYPATDYYTNDFGAVYTAMTIHEDLYPGIVASSKRIKVYYDIVKRWTGNTTYTDITQIQSTKWNTDSGIAQIPDTANEFPFQIVAYNTNNLTTPTNTIKGVAPNVFIKKLTATQISGDTAIPFTPVQLKNPEIGKSVNAWTYRYKNETDELASELLSVGTEYSRMRTENLTMFMLFASPTATEYEITFDNSDEEYTYEPQDTYLTIGQTITVTATYEPETLKQVTAVIWMARNNLTGEWDEIEWNQFETVNAVKDSPISKTLPLTISAEFITKYAQGEFGSYIFEIKAEYSYSAVFSVSVKLPDNIDSDSSTALNVSWVTYNENTSGVEILENSTIQLTAIYNTVLYDFGQFVITGADTTYEVVTNDVNSSYMSIKVLGNIGGISFTLVPKKYDINIQLFSLASGNLRVTLTDTNMIETDSELLADAAYVGANLSGITVTDFYEDTQNNCYYKFVNWQLSGPTATIESTDNIFSYSNIKADIMNANLQDLGGGVVFNLSAIFQRQVKLVVNMDPEGLYDGYDNSYNIYYGDELLTLTQFMEDENTSHYGVIINENILLRIEFFPDTRLAITEIEDISISQRKDFANNTLYLSLNTFRQVDIDMDYRDANVSLFTRKIHEQEGLVSSGTSSIILINDTDKFDAKLNQTYTFTYDASMENRFRFVSFGIKKVTSEGFVPLTFTEGVCELTADYDFFRECVDINGNCEIWMSVAVTYEVDITAEGFTRTEQSADKTYNKYVNTVTGNSFELVFTGNVGGIQSVNSFAYIVDHGTEITYVPVDSAHSTFATVNGLIESELNDNTVTVTSSRQLAFIFFLNQYNLNLNKVGAGKASIDNYTETFELNSTITISCTVGSTYVIKNIKIDGKTLAELGAVQTGNTVTIKADNAFLQAIGASTVNKNIDLEVNISTTMAGGVMGGIFGGAAGIMILFAAVVLLVIRNKRVNAKRKKAEELNNEYAKRFNIASVISDLKAQAEKE